MIYLGKLRVAGHSELIDSAIDKVPISSEGTQPGEFIQGTYNRYQDTETNLVINQLTESQYYHALLVGAINDNELYLIEESSEPKELTIGFLETEELLSYFGNDVSAT